MTRAKSEQGGAKLEKKLILIAALSFVVTMGIFFTRKPVDNERIFNTLFEIGMMTGLVFIVIAINFFAISFVVRKIRDFFK